ncbi:hypothetical protein ACFV9C_43230 [Kribbella sp. NPDC059898]|uniref:hypothetical protein n=1 Tax=Kribbella sp. NPDC059898 TaxID=3346995 RepID=UPI00364AE1B2
MDERRRMLEANAAAAQFFRRELLRATGGWPLEYLRAHGADSVLLPESPWKFGYAPRTVTNLVDHLHDQGFGFGTLARAGLLDWNEFGEATDLHRDKLMLMARDRRLSGVGFVGIGPDGVARSVSPVTAIHRPAGVVVGVAEQRELLAHGAVPVLVDSPMDAIAVSNVSGEFVAVPLCGGGLSTSQAKTLREFSVSDKVVVVLSGREAERKQSLEHVGDLAFFFDRVRVVGLGPGESLATLAQKDLGAARVNDVLENSHPVMAYRSSGRAYIPAQTGDRDPPGPGF